ncbi:MAG: hypothetical protein AB1555_17790 [Nitrospirota bacterium]
MAFEWTWRVFRAYRKWKQATTPVLLNTETGELIGFDTYTTPGKGNWVLRRPLTLPGSTLPLFLTAKLSKGDEQSGGEGRSQTSEQAK